MDIPAAGPWTITINQPRGDAASCFDDPAVSSSIMTADLPSSAASAQLMFAATRDDATRVVDCLRTTLTSGTVTVYTRH